MKKAQLIRSLARQPSRPTHIRPRIQNLITSPLLRHRFFTRPNRSLQQIPIRARRIRRHNYMLSPRFLMHQSNSSIRPTNRVIIILSRFSNRVCPHHSHPAIHHKRHHRNRCPHAPPNRPRRTTRPIFNMMMISRVNTMSQVEIRSRRRQFPRSPASHRQK